MRKSSAGLALFLVICWLLWSACTVQETRAEAVTSTPTPAIPTITPGDVQVRNVTLQPTPSTVDAPALPPAGATVDDTSIVVHLEMLETSRTALETALAGTATAMKHVTLVFDSVQSDLETLKWIIGISWTALAAIGVGGLAAGIRAMRKASDSIALAERGKRQAQQLLRQTAAAKAELNEVREKTQHLDQLRNAIQEQLNELSTTVEGLRGDAIVVEKPMLLYQVLEHAIRVFDANRDEALEAAAGLSQDLQQPEPVARWFAVRAVRMWIDQNGAQDLEIRERLTSTLRGRASVEAEPLVLLELSSLLSLLRDRFSESANPPVELVPV